MEIPDQRRLAAWARRWLGYGWSRLPSTALCRRQGRCWPTGAPTWSRSERPQGDPLRAHARAGLTPGTADFDVVIEQFNRNKRGVAIDLRTDAGHTLPSIDWSRRRRRLPHQLPPRRRAQKLRIDVDDVFAVNPNLVYARGHGQGQRGPDADTGGFDSVSFWSRGGVAHMLTPARRSA